MKKWISAVMVMFLGVSLAACSTMDRPNPDSSKQYIGLFSGAIAGGVLGATLGQKGGGRVTALSIGAVVGAIIGAGLGMYLDDLDRDKVLTQQSGASKKVYNRKHLANKWPFAPEPQALNVKPEKQPSIEKKELAAVKTKAGEIELSSKALAVKKVSDKKEPAKKEATAKSNNVNDKILSLWKHLPSTQWFVNDVKQEDVG